MPLRDVGREKSYRTILRPKHYLCIGTTMSDLVTAKPMLILVHSEYINKQKANEKEKEKKYEGLEPL